MFTQCNTNPFSIIFTVELQVTCSHLWNTCEMFVFAVVIQLLQKHCMTKSLISKSENSSFSWRQGYWLKCDYIVYWTGTKNNLYCPIHAIQVSFNFVEPWFELLYFTIKLKLYPTETNPANKYVIFDYFYKFSPSLFVTISFIRTATLKRLDLYS